MFNFLKGKPSPKTSPEARNLVKGLAGEDGSIYPFRLKSFPSGLKIQNADAGTQRLVVLALIEWLDHNQGKTGYRNNWYRHWKMRNALFALLKRRLPFTEDDLHCLLDWSERQNYNHARGVPHMIKVLTNYLKEGQLSDPLRDRINALTAAIQKQRSTAMERRWVMRLQKLTGEYAAQNPLIKGDLWADAAKEHFQSLPAREQTVWAEFLLHCLRVSGSTPSRKWRKEAGQHIAAIGQEQFRTALLDWLPLVSEPRPEPALPYRGVPSNPNLVWYLEPVNSDILKGLVWTCSQFEDPEMVRAISALAMGVYKKIPGTGPRSAKVGNACFWTLGQMSGMESIAQLSILKLRIKGNTPQKAIAKALESASARAGISADEIEEMSIPDYGLQEVGLRHEKFGAYTYELRLTGGELEQVWTREDAKQLKSIPKAVRESYPDEWQAVKQTVKDIRKMLPAQRNRIDNLYLAQKTWPLEVWRERYIEHPLVGTIGRRLIWKFSRGDQAASGIWFEGELVDRQGQTLDWVDADARAELWHPIHGEPDGVLAWREWLREHEIRQPFKQAYREIYVLTEAERDTRVYSNRFAAHVLRQHQFNALCAARGWKNSLRLLVDDYFPPAAKPLPQWNLRAEYWIEGIGDNYGTDTNEAGTFLYLTTDQVRFYAIESQANVAHAGGGGYQVAQQNAEGDTEPLPLEQIPPLVFSEIMRDVDLFVGVASVGNDPNWLDGGPEVRHQEYWHSYSFGDLSETAKTRKQVLEVVLPRLKIAQRCRLTNKYLVVRGDIRTYKIHLGSSNILMEPNDRYLCIVPARGGALPVRERVFLPFEGDQTLAVILSKAFMLAEDRKISDPTIIRQIKW